jgi:biopolymer transport protein ExbB
VTAGRATGRSVAIGIRAGCIALAIAGLALSWTEPAAAQAVPTFAAAAGDVDRRLEGSLQELAKLRDRIAKEKIPLSKSVASLESEVLELRREQARLLEIRDSRTLDLSSLRKEVDSLEDQEDFVDARLAEFVREFEGRLDASELAGFEGLTAEAKLAEKNPNLDVVDRRERQVRVVQAALGRLRDQLGGHVFPGEALSPEGVLTQGTFVALGPTVFYVSDDGETSGLVEARLNAADPVVVALPGLNGNLADVARGELASLPLDPTLGKALKTRKAAKGLGDYVADGGVVGYVILGLGLAALLLTVFKGFEILGFPVAEPKQVDAILDDLAAGSAETASRKAGRVPGISGELLSTGVDNAGEKRGILEEMLFEKILKARPTLERFLPFLAITAAAAPLLGLLGTVIGMIKTFQLITIFGTGDAKSLSSGISEALVTTALGLIVAIPTLILHGALTRMAKHKLGALEQLSVAFVNGVVAIRRSGHVPDDE